MPFGHKFYVPILKGKRAEFCALGSLTSTETITPLIEAVPSKDPLETPRRMAEQWSPGTPYFIDLLFLDATILAQLRYAAPDAWLVWKGRNAITDGFDQFLAICADIVARPEFSGAGFSWGDAQIAEKAASGGSCGNAQTWRQIGTSHHLETVLDQIANLP